MHVRKVTEELWALSNAAGSIDTYVKAAVLLDVLAKDNEDVETTERPNGTVREKIQSARNWFGILCGIGEEGGWADEQVRLAIGQALSSIRGQICAAGGSTSSRFQRWPLTGTTD